MSKKSLLGAIKRYGNYRENIGGVFKDHHVRKRTRAEWRRVENAVMNLRINASDLPARRLPDDGNRPANSYNAGWNACIDALLGKE